MPDAIVGTPLHELSTIVEIRTTVSCRDHATTLARRLIDERLAACVQIDGPVTSLYRWQGAVETGQEFRCTCKTSAARAACCVAAILATHEYTTPELLVTAAQASPAYAAWVLAEVDVSRHEQRQGDADRPAQ